MRTFVPGPTGMDVRIFLSNDRLASRGLTPCGPS
jgi:hypothetical protein